jgi:hypothetical protein
LRITLTISGFSVDVLSRINQESSSDAQLARRVATNARIKGVGTERTRDLMPPNDQAQRQSKLARALRTQRA